MKEPISTAVLSYGMSGEIFHAPLLQAHPKFTLQKIWQRNSVSATLRYPEIQVGKTINDILEDPQIELVIVNTPNETHYDFARLALEAGKHVIVEKPFTNTTDEAHQLINLAKNKNKTLSVFQNRRWDGDFCTVKKVIEWGMVGHVVEFEAHYDRFRNYISPQTWKEEPGPGSGILYNLGSHLLDQALVLFGMPQSVTAFIGIQRPQGKVDDFFDLRLEYSDLHVILKSSYLVREPGPHYIVHGVNGSFVKYGLDPQEEALKQGNLPDTTNWGAEPEDLWGTLNTNINGLHYKGKIETIAGNYLAFYNNIFEAIREGKDLIVKPQQALQVIQLIEAAVKSNRERRTIEVL